jgi:GNAT superfamily N-acetyltransferase
MPDMLVKLYALPQAPTLFSRLAIKGVDIRRALAPEKRLLADWVGTTFDAAWAGEVDVAFARVPISCFVAVYRGEPVGFGCYDCAARGYFGPTGVLPAERGAGIGQALLLACLEDMRVQGYGYGIIGGAGQTEFYSKAVSAVEIPNSTPGIYAGLLSATNKS